MSNSLKIMVLAGGPDREREVSLLSGAAVTEGLREAGHEVIQRDIGPDDLVALDEFLRWCDRGDDCGGNRGGVIFPALHGAWGEGGSLQALFDERGLRYVGCDASSSALCMDKRRAKEAMLAAGIATPGFTVVRNGEAIGIDPPVVVKPSCEGSSIDITICRDGVALDEFLDGLNCDRQKSRGDEMLVEQFVAGKELTVGVIGGEVLVPLQIIPATGFYDYDAKYVRDDTQYIFDIDLPTGVLDQVQAIAWQTFEVLGCRHLSRVDLIVDDENQAWVLEVNTMPGFTSHSLVPKAAAHGGVSLSALVDRLVRMVGEKG